MIYTLFVIFIVIASLLMIGIVLIQESKGGGLASNFSSSNAILGVRKTTDFVEKATWGLAITMVVLSIVCAHVAPVSSEGTSVMEKTATETQTTNPNTTPGFGASQSKLAPSSSSATGDAAEFSLDTTDSNTPGSCIPAIFTIIPATEAIISGFFARLWKGFMPTSTLTDTQSRTFLRPRKTASSA